MIQTSQDRQPGLGTSSIVGTLTLTKTGTTARTATFPDAAITVAGINLAQTWTATQSLAAISCTTLGATGAISTTNNTASTSVITGSGVFGGGIGASGTIYAYAGNYARSVNNYSGIDAQNTSNGTAAGARTGVYGDTTASLELICNSTGNTGTRFGITKASYGELVGRGAALSGVIIGCDSVDKPVIFGINASEVARFTSGTLSTGKLDLKYTTDGALTVAGKITAKVAVPASFADLAAVRTYLASILT